MILSNCNIQDLVTEQIEAYLANNTFTFQTLKDYIISKAPILEIQTLYIKSLHEHKTTDFNALKKNMEANICKQQIADDEKLSKQLKTEEKNDEQLKLKLATKLSNIPALLAHHKNECEQLRHKLNQLSRQNIPLRKEPSFNKKNMTPKLVSDETELEIEKLNSSILEHELKIKTLAGRHMSILIKQSEIEQRVQARHRQLNKIKERAIARAAYQSTGERVLDTLSKRNQMIFSKNMQDQHMTIEQKFDALVKNADSINYAFFLEALPKHLKELKLPPSEQDALNLLLKTMKEHFLYEQQCRSKQEDLNTKNRLIHNQLARQSVLNTQLKRLRSDNPSLKKVNQGLDTQVTQANTRIELNNKLRKRLALPGLLLLGLSFLSTIPLILTWYGIIPFFIAPVFLFTLTMAPPIALAIATLAIGIAALVYKIRTHSNKLAVVLNTQTITNNKNEVKRNSQSLLLLEKQTIPNLKKQIKQNEESRDLLISSLSQLNLLVQQSLAKAMAITPVSYATTLILNPASSSDDEINLSEESTDLIEFELT